MDIRGSILLLIVVSSGLLSCKNNDNVFKPVIPSFVNVVNASADTVNIYLNGTRQNNNSNLLPVAQSFYLPIPAGIENFQFKKAGTIPILFSLPLILADSVNYSLYIAGETSDKSFSTIDRLLIDSGSTTVRFVNASPDVGNVTITIGDTAYVKNTSFKLSSEFFKMGSGKKNVKMYVAGVASPKIDTIITMQPSSAYTLFSKGSLNGKGSAVFNIGVVFNASK